VVLPVTRVARSAWRPQGITDGERVIPEETAVAFAYNGCFHAVMMATPQDLEDFALGFSLTEHIVCAQEEIGRLEIIERDFGIELRMGLSEPVASTLNERRRYLAGPTGYGLRGIETLAKALRLPPRVADGQIFTPAEIMRALETFGPHQELNRQTRAVHAAGFWEPGAGLIVVREDVGRHNALDKLGGALVCDRIPRQSGLILVTGRVSAEMVQKAAVIGATVLIAASVPTGLAVRTAETAGITLVAVARGDGFEIFTHPRRISKDSVAYVA